MASIISRWGVLMFLLLLYVPAFSETVSQFVKVTDVSALEDGDSIIIVNEKSKMALGVENTSVGRWRAVGINIDNGAAVPNSGVRVFGLGKTGGYYYLKSNDGKYFVEDEGLKVGTTAKSGSEWIITCSPDSAYVVFKTTKKKLNFNETAQLFTCYNSYSQQSPISIYRRTEGMVRKQKTKVLFSKEGSFVIEEGEEDTFSSPVASVVDMNGNILADSKITYLCSNTGIAEIDVETGVLNFNTNKIFGTFVVTAEYKGDEFYDSSEASYTVEYKNKGKTETKISFGADVDDKPIVVYKGKELDFLCPKATLTPSNAGEVAYSSSNESVAKIDAAGNIEFGELGESVITAMFAGNEDYEQSSASYVIKYLPQSILFSDECKSFSNVSEKETTAATKTSFISQDGTSYEFKIKNAKRSSNKLVLSGGGTASLVEHLGVAEGYTVIVSYEQSYSKDKPTTVLSLYYWVGDDKSESTYAKIIKLNGSSSSFEATMDVPGDYTFAILAGANQARISKIEIIPNTTINVVIDESVDNKDAISNAVGKKVDVALKRTLVANKWNTFCVPFDVKEAAEMLKGAEIKEYNEQKGVVDDVMYFKKTNSIVAGFPYLIKPTENIENPTFKNVVVSVDTPKSVGNDDYKFVGVFSPLTFDDTMSDTSLFLSGDERLVYPKLGTTMRGMRAYFSFPGNMPAQSAKIFMDDEETSVTDVYGTQKANVEKIFNINGVYVGMSLETLPKGVYVKAGKKFVK